MTRKLSSLGAALLAIALLAPPFASAARAPSTYAGMAPQGPTSDATTR